MTKCHVRHNRTAAGGMLLASVVRGTATPRIADEDPEMTAERFKRIKDLEEEITTKTKTLNSLAEEHSSSRQALLQFCSSSAGLRNANAAFIADCDKATRELASACQETFKDIKRLRESLASEVNGDGGAFPSTPCDQSEEGIVANARTVEVGDGDSDTEDQGGFIDEDDDERDESNNDDEESAAAATKLAVAALLSDDPAALFGEWA